MRPRSIVIDTKASETERFAAAELDRYLGRMLGARLGVKTSKPGAGSIVVKARRRTPLVRVPVREEDRPELTGRREPANMTREGD